MNQKQHRVARKKGEAGANKANCGKRKQERCRKTNEQRQRGEEKTEENVRVEV